MDPDLGRFQVVWAAAGTPTAVFPVPPGDPADAANAHVAPICEERRPADVLAEGAGLEPRAGARTPAPDLPRPSEWPPSPATRSSSSRAGSERAAAGRGAAAAPAVFALTEAGGPLTDLGELAGADPDRRCRAELRVDTPGGSLDGPARVARSATSQPACCGTPGLLVRQVRVPRLRRSRHGRRAALDPPVRLPTPRRARLVAAGPRDRPGGDRDVRAASPTARSRGGSPTRTS